MYSFGMKNIKIMGEEKKAAEREIVRYLGRDVDNVIRNKHKSRVSKKALLTFPFEGWLLVIPGLDGVSA